MNKHEYIYTEFTFSLCGARSHAIGNYKDVADVAPYLAASSSDFCTTLNGAAVTFWHLSSSDYILA